MRPEETGLNRIKLDQQMETGLIRITFKSYTVQNCHSDWPRTCRPNMSIRAPPSGQKTKTRGKIKNISIMYLFIILNILARVRITKIGYRSILPSRVIEDF